MPDLVVDTSIVIGVITEEPIHLELLRLTSGRNIVASESMPFEVGNAISAAMKRGRMTFEQATIAVSLYQAMQIELYPIDLLASGVGAQSWHLRV